VPADGPHLLPPPSQTPTRCRSNSRGGDKGEGSQASRHGRGWPTYPDVGALIVVFNVHQTHRNDDVAKCVDGYGPEVTVGPTDLADRALRRPPRGLPGEAAGTDVQRARDHSRVRQGRLDCLSACTCDKDRDLGREDRLPVRLLGQVDVSGDPQPGTDQDRCFDHSQRGDRDGDAVSALEDRGHAETGGVHGSAPLGSMPALLPPPCVFRGEVRRHGVSHSGGRLAVVPASRPAYPLNAARHACGPDCRSGGVDLLRDRDVQSHAGSYPLPFSIADAEDRPCREVRRAALHSNEGDSGIVLVSGGDAQYARVGRGRDWHNRQVIGVLRHVHVQVVADAHGDGLRWLQ